MIDPERLARALLLTREHVAYPKRWEQEDFEWVARQVGAEYARLSAEQPQVVEGYVNPDGSGKGNWWKG